MSLYRHLLLSCSLLLLLATPALAQQNKLAAQVDRTRIDNGETLTLMLSYNGQVRDDPNFASLNKEFEVLSNQRQSQFSMGSGAMSSITTWKLTLLPMRSGELLIPSFRVKDAVSDAIAVTVTQNSSTSAQGKQIYTEVLLDKNSVYVQEQLVLTLRLYTTVSLQDFQSTELDVAGARLVKIASNQFQKSVNGINYTIAETKFALFSENSGELVIPPVRFSGTVPDARDPFGGSLFSRGGKPVVLHTEQKTVQVKPRPDSARGKAWLPSTGISLTEKWSNTSAQLVMGEPVTRTITIAAQGLTGAQLPPLAAADTEGLRTYPDQARIDDTVSADSVVGQRVESVALVPTRPGALTIAPTRLQWWDTDTDTWRETVLEGKTFTVVASGKPAGTDNNTVVPSHVLNNGLTIPAAPPQLSSAGGERTDTLLTMSLIISNGFFILCSALFAVLWWRRRKQTEIPVDEHPSTTPSTDKDLFKTIRVSAGRGDLISLRSAIIQWARYHWGQNDLITLDQIATLANNQELTQYFRELDAHLYGSAAQSTLSLDNLVTCLDTLRRNRAEQTAAQPFALQPLYPQ